MPSIIRLAVPQDAELLPSIEMSAAQSFRSVEGLTWLADSLPMSVELHSQLIAQSTCWVAVDAENQPLGFISAKRHGNDLHINELSVMQSMQGRGLGRKLIEEAKRYARSNALRFVTLTTFKSVPWNAPFYTRLGFQIKHASDLDQRLAAALSDEYKRGFAPASRCAMFWPVS
ncbi:GNAT family N-acetyltransferase [Pseudomonas sp. LB3P31]